MPVRPLVSVTPLLVVPVVLVALAGCGGSRSAPPSVGAPVVAVTTAATGPSMASPSVVSPSAVSPSAVSPTPASPSPTGSSPASVSATPRLALSPSRSASPGAAAVSTPAVRTAGAPVVVLDPGHNGGNASNPEALRQQVPAGGFTKDCNTTGTETNAGYPEHAFAWDVALRARALLQARGVKVVLTRPDDVSFGPCVDHRAAIANAAHAAAVVSIHADGGPSTGTGFHVIVPGEAPDHGNRAVLAPSKALGLAVRASFHQLEPYANYLAGGDGLDQRSDLAGLNLARAPSVFIECANMRGAADAARTVDPAWRQQAAQRIADGVLAYLAGG